MERERSISFHPEGGESKKRIIKVIKKDQINEVLQDSEARVSNPSERAEMRAANKSLLGTMEEIKRNQEKERNEFLASWDKNIAEKNNPEETEH